MLLVADLRKKQFIKITKTHRGFSALCQMLWSIPDRNIFCPVFHEQNPIESRCFRWFLRSGLFNKNIIRRLKFTKFLKL